MPKVELEYFEELSYGKREAFNSLRTNLSFCGDDVKVILVTSCTPDEGKSSTTMELARSLAENEKKVLLIDADLRKSVLVGRYHAVKQQKEKIEESKIQGLTHYLAGKNKLDEIICQTNIANLDIIFAGHVTPSPTELLDNNYFMSLISYARDAYDVVLIDSPPLGSVIDAAIVAPKCDGTILLVEAGKCSYRFVREVKKQLEMTGVRILGVVLNKVQVEKGGYYNRYYQGYYSGYYQSYSKE